VHDVPGVRVVEQIVGVEAEAHETGADHEEDDDEPRDEDGLAEHGARQL
jgi:hypothetical protein